MKSMATLATLYSVVADKSTDTTYYTPNGYYRWDLPLTETLRWLDLLQVVPAGIDLDSNFAQYPQDFQGKAARS